MKKLVIALPLTLAAFSAAAFPGAPEYTGTLATTPISIMNSQNNQIGAELLTLQTGLSNTPADTWQVFGTFITNPVRVQNSNISQPGYRDNADAFTLGTDYHTPHGIYGVAVGRNMGTLTYARGNGSAQVDENLASIFAGYKLHHFYGSAIATYGNIDDSNINHNIGAQNLTGQTTGQQTDLNGTLGYNFICFSKKLRTGPLVNIDYQNITINGFAETPTNAGAIGVPLQFGKQDYDSLISGAGWQVNYATQFRTTQLVPYLQTTYNHQFLNMNRNIKAAAGVFSPATTIFIPYTVTDNSFVNVNTGIQAVFSSGLDLTLAYNTALGQNTVDNESVMISASMPVL
ncbi:MAG TPA: autotransporter outer membrane beta-barrel domain-containing protein [Gammaproteobacteria bacterium]|nr:autotransporter outer membrane beta-barrel domain-containing protein [Gammaproteobacteria bacterium]